MTTTLPYRDGQQSRLGRSSRPGSGGIRGQAQATAGGAGGTTQSHASGQAGEEALLEVRQTLEDSEVKAVLPCSIQ